MDPLTDTPLEVCCAETAALAPSQEALFSSNSVLLLAFGLLTGLFSGFSLGISASTTLVSGR